MRAVKKIKGLVTAVRGLMLLVVFVAIVLMVTAMAQEMVREYLSRLSRHSYTPVAQKELTEEQKHDKILRNAARKWLPDGTMHLVYYSGHLVPSSGPKIFGLPERRLVEIYDTEVSLLWSGPEEERPYAYLSGPELYGRWHGFYFTGAEFLIDFSRSLVVPVVSAEKVKVENWRYVPSGGYFAGYDARGETIGYLGAEGFRSEKGKVRGLGRFNDRVTAWAPRDSYTPKVLWQSEKVLWQIDFEKREVEKLYESKEQILNIHLFGWRGLKEQEASLRGAIAVFEKEGCHLIIDNPREVIAIELAAEYSQISHYVSLLRNKNDFYVEVSGSKGAPVDFFDRAAVSKWFKETRGKPIEKWEELYRLEDSGELELIKREDWTKPAYVQQKESLDRAEEFKKYTTAAAPVVFRPISKWRVEARNEYRNDYGNFFMRGLDEIIIYTAPTNMFYCLLLSLLSVCAAVYHGWGRRRSLAGLIGWLVFVGVFNVAGLLTYLAMNHKAVLRCSACGKKRHLMGDVCVRCGAGLPAPEGKETDLVFAG